MRKCRRLGFAPADGTNAAFEITGLRLVPLAALLWNLILPVHFDKTIMESRLAILSSHTQLVPIRGPTAG